MWDREGRTATAWRGWGHGEPVGGAGLRFQRAGQPRGRGSLGSARGSRVLTDGRWRWVLRVRGDRRRPERPVLGSVLLPEPGGARAAGRRGGGRDEPPPTRAGLWRPLAGAGERALGAAAAPRAASPGLELRLSSGIGPSTISGSFYHGIRIALPTNKTAVL